MLQRLRERSVWRKVEEVEGPVEKDQSKGQSMASFLFKNWEAGAGSWDEDLHTKWKWQRIGG